MKKTATPSLDDVLIEYEQETIEQDLGTAIYSFTLTSIVLYGVDLTHKFHEWPMSECPIYKLQIEFGTIGLDWVSFL